MACTFTVNARSLHEPLEVLRVGRGGARISVRLRNHMLSEVTQTGIASIMFENSRRSVVGESGSIPAAALFPRLEDVELCYCGVYDKANLRCGDWLETF